MHIACPLNALAPGDAIRLEHSRPGGLALGSYPPAIVDGGHTSVKAVKDEPFGPPLAVETFPARSRKPSRWPTTD